MVEILRNKNLATKFQILTEIASSGPNVQQRDIAERLEVTPQAISDYIGQLIKEELIVPDSHSKYRITNSGVNWMIRTLRELKDYSDFVVKAISNISVCAAIADDRLVKGQEVGLEMKDGLLYATRKTGSGARGIAFSDAEEGQDVGVSKVEGIVQLEPGNVGILKVPNVQKGGSRRVSLERLKHLTSSTRPLGAIGIEALIALRKAEVDTSSIFGVKETVVEAALHGMCPLVVCVEDEISGLIKRLEDHGIVYNLVDLTQ